MAVKITDANGAKINLKSSMDNGEAVVHHNIDKLPGTSEADIAAIKAAIEILDNAISGTEMQVDIQTISVPTATYNGQKTVTSHGTAEALGSSQAILSGVRVKALSTNTGNVYVGNSSVDSSNGFVLAAGESDFWAVANIATLYIDSDVDGEGVCYHAE
jgi:hypothetical protein